MLCVQSLIKTWMKLGKICLWLRKYTKISCLYLTLKGTKVLLIVQTNAAFLGRSSEQGIKLLLS